MDDLERLARSTNTLTVCGAPEGYDSLIFADLARARGGVSVFIASDEARASAFDAALEFFAPGIDRMRLPAWDCQPYDRISPSPRTAARRAGALHRLAAYSGAAPLIVVTTVNAVLQRCAPKSAMAAGGISAKPGGVLDV